jgi:hypothetical protein
LTPSGGCVFWISYYFLGTEGILYTDVIATPVAEEEQLLVAPAELIEGGEFMGAKHNVVYYLDLWNSVLSKLFGEKYFIKYAYNSKKAGIYTGKELVLVIDCGNAHMVKNQYIWFRLMEEDLGKDFINFKNYRRNNPNYRACNIDTPPPALKYTSALNTNVSRSHSRCCIM